MNKNEFIENGIIEKLKDGCLYRITDRYGVISYYYVSGDFYEVFKRKDGQIIKYLVPESIVRLAIKRALLWNFNACLVAAY